MSMMMPVLLAADAMPSTTLLCCSLRFGFGGLLLFEEFALFFCFGFSARAAGFAAGCCSCCGCGFFVFVGLFWLLWW